MNFARAKIYQIVNISKHQNVVLAKNRDFYAQLLGKRLTSSENFDNHSSFFQRVKIITPFIKLLFITCYVFICFYITNRTLIKSKNNM